MMILLNARQNLLKVNIVERRDAIRKLAVKMNTDHQTVSVKALVCPLCWWLCKMPVVSSSHSQILMLTVMAQAAAAKFSLIIGVATQAIPPYQP